jgi:twitching motility protein PilT
MSQKHDLIDYLMAAVQHGSSDVHLTAGAAPMVRIGGILRPLTETALTPEDTRRLVMDVLKETQRSQLEQTWQLDFAIQVEGVGRFRGNACYTLGNMEANFRFISDSIPDLPTLGHSPVVDEWCNLKSGMVLVTGTSGAGKSTTLASMIQTICYRRRANVVSIEDPIEYVFKQGSSLVNQREVGTDTRSFADGLRNALRQDADVIIIGELRDEESIHIALTAAETGHLVVATMHTTDAPSAIARILDAYPQEQQKFAGSQLAWALKGVVCQFLLPRSDQAGLVLATEIMQVNTAIGACIRDRRLSQITGLMQIGSQDGMHTVDDSLIELTLADRINLQDAMSHARDPNMVKERFQEGLKGRRKGWFTKLTD